MHAKLQILFCVVMSTAVNDKSFKVGNVKVRDALTLTTAALPTLQVAVVHVTEGEYRQMDDQEIANLKTAAMPGGCTAHDLEPEVMRRLIRRGLLHLHVSVSPNDRFSVPPLEGFVSNRTSDASDAAADPVEAALYAIFVANSEHMQVSRRCRYSL